MSIIDLVPLTKVFSSIHAIASGRIIIEQR